jgi:catechol 2,3-dioxygenase-like lactoylglutathione lyase family enzyme
MQASGPGLSRIAQVALVVHDVDRAAAFYGGSLGLKELFRFPPKLAFFDCAGTRLMLSLPEKPEFDHPNSVLYFDVPDIRQAQAALRERGVAFVDDPHVVAKLEKADLWMCFFRDPEENLLAIQSEVPRG